MNVSLLLSASSSLSGPRAAQTDAGATPSAPKGFQSALRQAFDLRGDAPSESAAPDSESLDAFRDALAALEVDVEALDDASLEALYHATEEALSAAAEGKPMAEAFGDLLAAFGGLGSSAQPLASRDLVSTLPSTRTQGTILAETIATDTDTTDAGALGPLGSSKATPLDEVTSRLALMASFNAPSSSPASGEAEAALKETTTRILAALAALRGEPARDMPTQGLPSTGEVRTLQTAPAAFSQPPLTLYGLAQTAVLATGGESMPVAPIPGASEMAPLAQGMGQVLPSGAEAPMPGSAQATPAAAPATAIATPVTHPGFAEKLGQQLIQLTQRGGEQHVKIELHPAELGPLSISLKMGEHGTQAQFFSAHAQVRQAIEQAIPQLREALAEQGIALGDTSVGQQNTSDREAFAQTGGSAQGGASSADDDVEGVAPTPASVVLDGRVDLYA
ncbi:flagellar hook-length control protein FliK [Vreelandella malpeensis]|uniref:Flagellar hook-length control protein FliK n=1 Tax=Vreelandella malpeensis TaxID=1172368 RepID=A0ABS8DQC0_9GAMM|nr:flagellar hook-length control protein FliK [Halomonas malpeensis]MCB8888513.1 flagellar hook-length control protein FliK [Halomonas malpeensis]